MQNQLKHDIANQPAFTPVEGQEVGQVLVLDESLLRLVSGGLQDDSEGPQNGW